MMPFLFVLLLVGAAVISALVVSLYLYKEGAMSSSPVNRSRSIAMESLTDDSTYLYMDASDETTRFARSTILLTVVVLMVLVMFLYMLVSALH